VLRVSEIAAKQEVTGVVSHQSAPGAQTWLAVCAVDDIEPDTGVAVLVSGEQVALVRVDDTDVYAISNFDPFSKAFVISRGIVGDQGGVPKIASPIFKQSFDLRTGRCLDDAVVRLPTWPVRVRGGQVEIGIAASAGAGARE
jgi:nitrite reductase (NADH) small subunit